MVAAAPSGPSGAGRECTVPPHVDPPPHLQRWGPFLTGAGVAALAFVGLLLAALVLDALAPPPVEGGAATLEFIAAHQRSYVAEQVLWIAPAILAVLVFVALFLALSPTAPGLALTGAVVGGVSYAALLAIPTSSRGALALVELSRQYTTAAPGDRAAYAIAAEALVAENNTPTIAGVLTTVGVLMVSLAMLRGGLPRALAWLGIATGVVGVVSELLRYAAPQFYWVYGVLLWAWFVAVGVALLRLGRRLRTWPTP